MPNPPKFDGQEQQKWNGFYYDFYLDRIYRIIRMSIDRFPEENVQTLSPVAN
jgi:hypothetical protein